MGILGCDQASGSIRRRVFLGVGSSVLSQAILAIQPILFIPFFLRAWGDEGYGRWLALTAFVSYMSLLDLGGQYYIGNLLAITHARKDEVYFRKILSEGVSLFLFIAVSGFSILAILLLSFSRFPIPILDRPLETSEAWILGLLGGALLHSVPAGIYVLVYRASGLFVRGTMIGNVFRLLGFGILFGLLYASVTPVVFAAGMLGTGVITTLFIVWDTRRMIPECHGIQISLAQAQKGWVHLSGAFYFWLMALARAASQQGMLLILAASATPALVAVYATHRTLANIPGYIGILVQGPLLPELSFLWGKERLSELSKTVFLALRIVLFSTGAVAILLFLSAPLIYPVWTGKHLEVQPLLLGILLVQGVLAAGWSTSTWGRLAANDHRPLAIWSLVSAIVTIGLAVWMVQTKGAVGVALAGLLADLICGAIIFPVLAASFFKVSPSKIFTETSFAFLALLPFACIAILTHIYLKGWWSVAVFALFGLALTYPMLSIVVGRSEARKGVEMFRTVWNFKTR